MTILAPHSTNIVPPAAVWNGHGAPIGYLGRFHVRTLAAPGREFHQAASDNSGGKPKRSRQFLAGTVFGFLFVIGVFAAHPAEQAPSASVSQAGSPAQQVQTQLAGVGQ